MANIGYHYVFVGGAAVFYRVGQQSEFVLWQYLFCILYQQIVQSVFVEFKVLGCREYFSLMSTDVTISH